MPNLLDQLKTLHTDQVKQLRYDAQIERNIDRFEAYNARRILAGLEPLSLVDHIARLNGLPNVLADIESLLADPAKPTHRDNMSLTLR